MRRTPPILRTLVLCSGAILVSTPQGRAEEPVDLDMVTRIRNEGFRRSEVMDTAPAGRAGDDGVAGRAMVFDAEPRGVMAHEHAELLEGALVEQQLDALACAELAQIMLTVDRPLVHRLERLLAQRSQLLDAVFGAHGSPGSLRI